MKIIDETRLFKKIPNFFERPANVLIELAQNGQRAGATELAISLDGNVLTVSDNGRGADSAEPLFVLAASDWSDESVELADPAGWGLYYLLCLSTEVCYKSRFGSITVDCEKFMESAVYRSNILDNLDASDKEEGFLLRAVLKDGVAGSVASQTSDLGYFPLDITVNGDAIAKRDLSIESRQYRCTTVLKREYEGNDIYIRVGSSFSVNPSFIKDKIRVIWYGIPIGRDPYYIDVFIDVKNGSPLTPVLPYRLTIKEDQKLSALCDFLRRTVADYCIQQINDPSTTDTSTLTALMQVMENVGAPEELDRLDRFYVDIDEPHHRLIDPLAHEEIIHRSDPCPVSEVLSTIVVKYVTKKGMKRELYDEAPDELVLPQGAIKEVTAPRVHPSWLKVVTKEHALLIAGEETLSHLNYTWIKARKIVCAERRIQTVALVDSWGCGEIFFMEDPSRVDEISEAIFEGMLYNEDGDSYDTQQYEFEKEITEDIMRLKGAYEKRTLLDGLRITGLDVSRVVSIAFRGKKMTVKLKGGESKTILLAAA